MLSSYVSSNKQLSNNRNTSSSDNEIKALLVSNFEYPKILWQKTKHRERERERENDAGLNNDQAQQKPLHPPSSTTKDTKNLEEQEGPFHYYSP